MHVYWGVLEGVVEALFSDFALFADGAGLCDVGDVFVFFGEHEVCFAFAGCVVHPVVGYVYSLYIS